MAFRFSALRASLAAIAVCTLGACGGGDANADAGAGTDSGVTGGQADSGSTITDSGSTITDAGSTITDAGELQHVDGGALTGSCADGKMANVVGADDPLAVNSWQIKNTGSAQVVSAVGNAGAQAGIDARVDAAHQAGKGCTGLGVTVAIVDSALEIGHEDLKDNVVAGKSFNFANNSDDPSPAAAQASGDHGTNVGGVAASRGWNGKGTRGTGPLASVVGYPTVGVTKMASTSDAAMTYLSFGAKTLAGTEAVVATFGARADGVGVFNYSAGADYGAPTAVNDTDEQTLAAKEGTKTLRGGKGAIYFQATGNEFQAQKGALPNNTTNQVTCAEVLAADAALLGGTIANAASITCGSANQDPNNKPYFYQVASIHNTGKASSYSSASSASWVTGFGGEYGTTEAAIVTIDNTGCDSGTNNLANKAALMTELGAGISALVADTFGAGTIDPNCNYTGRFNGTSAATPSVSGIAALMLEANPALTWQDVGFILAKTARKVDADYSNTTANAPTFTATGAAVAWALDLPWITNGAGFNFQNRYGFGLIDADAAVKMSVGFATPAGRRTTGLTAAGAASATSKLNGAGVNTATATFADPAATSGPIRVDLTVVNNTGVAVNPGQLQFEIRNVMTGTRSILLPAFTSFYAGGKTNQIPAAGMQQFRMHTNAFYGEKLAGAYEVRIIDLSNSSGDTGKGLDFTPTLTSFSL